MLVPHWTNLVGANSSIPVPLVIDMYGTYRPPDPLGTKVSWSSERTWSSTGRGGENNGSFLSENRDLMAGYLDSGGMGAAGISITVNIMPGSGTPGSDFGYDVVVYIQGDVNGQGGLYTLTDEFGMRTIEYVVTGPFNGSFVYDDPTPGSPTGSNFIVFDEVFGRNLTLTATATIGKSWKPLRSTLLKSYSIT